MRNGMGKETISSVENNDEDMGFFENVNEILYIKKNPLNNSKYNFKKLDEKKTELLINIIRKLEQNENVIVCARGSSKKNRKEHHKFINDKLYDFFVVGDKAQYHIVEQLKKEHSHIKKDTKPIDEIKRLLPLVNEKINEWSLEYNGEIRGRISDKLIDDLVGKEKEFQEAWVLFFYAFLHNHGKNDFKPYSFLVSLSHGANKYETAKFFALNNGGKAFGIVTIYILEKDNDNYFTASELQQKLGIYGVKWFDDIRSEIFLINGLYPHNIVGFFELVNGEIKRFILNYWFYNQMTIYPDYDFSQGVYVDQGHNLDKFRESANKLDIRSYFFKYVDDTGKEYVNDIDGSNQKEVMKYKFE